MNKLTMKVIAVITERGPIADLSTIPQFIWDYDKLGEVELSIARIWYPAPLGGYMVSYKEEYDSNQAVYQGTADGISYFYPGSKMPHHGIKFFCTKQDAMDMIASITGMRSEINSHELQIVPFDHELENLMYNDGKWVITYPEEKRPIFTCPECKTPNPREEYNRSFICSKCGIFWPDSIYCPETGLAGVCTSTCTCWEIEYFNLKSKRV